MKRAGTNPAIFITGATGNLGGRLVASLLQDMPDAELRLLVRSKTDEEAMERVLRTLYRLMPSYDPDPIRTRCEVVRGDISLERLGLSETEYDRLAQGTTHIIHAAAATKFRMPSEAARSVNCTGTVNMTRFARRVRELGELKGYAHISTAYACGDRQGYITETPFDDPPSFSNIYEQTKWESEKYLLGHGQDLPLSIFRPSIIAGDSITGRINDFNVLYAPLRLILTGRVRILPCHPETPLDIVPLDFAARAIGHIFFSRPAERGQIYHIAAGNGHEATVEQIVSGAVEYCRQTFPDWKAPVVRFIPALAAGAGLMRMTRCRYRALELVEAYLPYFTKTRHFDTANAVAALKDSGISIPRFESYFGNLMKYFLEADLYKRLKQAA